MTTSDTNDSDDMLPPLLLDLTVDSPLADLNLAWQIYQGKITVDNTRFLEKSTRDQSENSLWFIYRKGRITGTRAHAVYKRRTKTHPSTLVKNIMGYSSTDISKKYAVAWGTNFEPVARKMYIETQSKDHNNFQCTLAGFFIHPTKSFLGVSADGLVSCDCCGKGVLEIKCSYKHRNDTFETALLDAKFYIDGDFKLKTGHQYCTQVQFEMLIHDVQYCDFVVYLDGLFIQRVIRDNDECTAILEKCECFFFKCVLPEIVYRKLELEVGDSDETAILYCTCRDIAYGEMSMCYGQRCPYRWYHKQCLGMKVLPDNKYMCVACKI